MLLAVCQELEIEIDSRIIPQIASGFAGGIGNSGSVCGAVIGGVMALGLARERPETMEGMLGALEVVREFRRRFEEEVGDVSCSALTGADLTTDKGIEAFMSSDAPMMVCFPAVTLAFRLVLDLLKECSPE